ncbi:MAG: hypothetical protein QOF89_4149 [Acidobacteriota bacterium]|jgi:hypothetical protein|nr:hypothetical protein [Acidobacteriota bacterium]
MLPRRTVRLLQVVVVLGSLALSGSLPAAAADPAGPLTVEAVPGGPVRGSAPMTVTLHLSGDLRNVIRKIPDRPADGPVARLTLNGFKAPNGANVHVFLNFAQASAATGIDDPHYVGAMSSFEDPAPNSPGDDIILDAAPTLRKLKKDGRILPGDNLTVTLVVTPGSAPDDVSIPIDRVALTIEPKAR